MERRVRRHLIQLGNYSTCVTLPKEILDKLFWKKKDEVEVEIDLEKQRLTIYKINNLARKEITPKISQKELKGEPDLKPLPEYE